MSSTAGGRKHRDSENEVGLAELISTIAGKTELDKSYISAFLVAFKEAVSDFAVVGRPVNLGSDFGRFSVVVLRGREYFIPALAEKKECGERRKIRFTASAPLAKRVQGA